ncbi:MAG: MFS transporter [Calditrichota bacterium]
MNSRLVIIFITIFIDLLGFGLVIPALPFYAESYGASPLVVGLLTMSYSLMQFIFAPLWGRVSDRVGRRPIILLGLAGAAGAFLVFGLAKSLTMLFVGRTLAGLLSSASLPTAQAYIADSTTPENRARGMGLIGAAFGLGFIFGPAVGGLLTKYGYGVPALVAAGLAALNFIWAYIRLPESLQISQRPQRQSYLSLTRLKETLADPRIAFLILLYFLVVFAFSEMESTFALFSEHKLGLGAIAVGALLGEAGIISAMIQGMFIGKMTKRFGEATLAIWGTLLMGIGFLLTTRVHSITGMILVLPLYALGSALTHPTLTALISRSVAEDRQGGALGISQGFSALARVLGPLFGTWIFQVFSPTAPYFAGGLVMLLAWLAANLRLKKIVAPVLEIGTKA